MLNDDSLAHAGGHLINNTLHSRVTCDRQEQLAVQQNSVLPAHFSYSSAASVTPDMCKSKTAPAFYSWRTVGLGEEEAVAAAPKTS